jgi:hypothetical protein
LDVERSDYPDQCIRLILNWQYLKLRQTMYELCVDIFVEFSGKNFIFY